LLALRHLVYGLSLVFALLLLWLTLLGIGTPTATTDMSSWRQAFGYAFNHDFRAGIDYVYTWGPLGYFFHPRADYASELFSAFMGFQLAFGLFSALVLTAYAHLCLQSAFQKILYFVLLILIVATFPPNAPQFISVIAAIMVLAYFVKHPINTDATQSASENKTASKPLIEPAATQHQRLNPAIEFGLLLFLALLALAKFTTFVLIGVGLISLSLFCVLQRDWRRAVWFPALFGLIFLALWWILEGTLSNIPRFLYYSLQVSKGYGEAMAVAGDHLQLFIALVVLVLTGLMLAADLLRGNRMTQATFVQLPLSLFLACAVFLAWKAGFIRQDTGHVIIFFTFMLILPFFIATASQSKLVTGLRCSIVFIALIGLFITTQPRYSADKVLTRWWQQVQRNISVYSDLEALHQQREQQLVALRQQYDLPQIRAVIGSNPVDIISWEQGVLLLNQLHWQPRPVFQSYVAYTPALAKLNAQFFKRPAAPRFVIFKLQTIDGRLPTLDDAPLLNDLLQRYAPVLTEKGYLLLAKNPDGRQLVSSPPQLLTTTLKFNQWHALEDFSQQTVMLQLHIQKSRLGHIAALLFRIPPIFIEFITEDDKLLRYRVIPAMLEHEVLINPLLLTQADISTWYTAPKTLPTIKQLRIVTTSQQAQYFYQPDMTLKLKGLTTHAAENAAQNLSKPRE